MSDSEVIIANKGEVMVIIGPKNPAASFHQMKPSSNATIIIITTADQALENFVATISKPRFNIIPIIKIIIGTLYNHVD